MNFIIGTVPLKSGQLDSQYAAKASSMLVLYKYSSLPCKLGILLIQYLKSLHNEEKFDYPMYEQSSQRVIFFNRTKIIKTSKA